VNVAEDSDTELLEAVQRGLEGGRLSMHVHYRRARKSDSFKDALVRETSARAVFMRDKFMGSGLTVLLVWFFVAEGLKLHEQTVRVLGSPMSLGFLSFALVLLALVMFYRQYIKPMQGKPMHRAALTSPELFVELWQSGSLALMTREGKDRLCQSPAGDWRQYVRQVMLLAD
jgi:hypothetical protein